MLSNRTISIYLLVISGLFLQFCRHPNKSLIDDKPIPEEIIRRNDSVSHLKPVDRLFMEIAALEQIEGEYIGYAGVKSKQPRYTPLLVRCADTSDLVRYTNSKNAIVKVFAFDALREKKYPFLKKIFEAHLFDKQEFYTFGGCIKMNIPVNAHFFGTVCATLTRDEVEVYKNELLKNNAAKVAELYFLTCKQCIY